jgi:hypothetical protein
MLKSSELDKKRENPLLKYLYFWETIGKFISEILIMPKCIFWQD